MTLTTIPLSQCVHRGLYRLKSRNFRLGVFNATTRKFVGIRQKFDGKYLDNEEHWDCGPPHDPWGSELRL